MKWLWFLRGHEELYDNNDNETLPPRLAVWGTIIVIVIFIGWARIAELDEVTRAVGTVIASSRTQLIESQDGGILEELLVKEGDQVQAGQILARVERTRAQAAYLETRATVAALMAKLSRLQAEALGTAPRFPDLLNSYPVQRENQLMLMKRRETALNEEITALETVRVLLEQELQMNTPLLELGDISKTELLRLQRQIAETNAQISNIRNAWFQDVQTELSETEGQLESLQQQLAQRQDVLKRTELLSPMQGIVKNVNINTLGGVIKPGEKVLEIVPLEEDLLIEARVHPRDIAFLKIGMPSTVKIDAYDYTIYGDLLGKLVFISADTLTDELRQGEEPYYRIRVMTEGRRFSARPELEIDVQTGMTATAEIKTGRRTVLNYLTKPIIKTLNESLGER
jgi:adhesin transport system membrane fusion protein